MMSMSPAADVEFLSALFPHLPRSSIATTLQTTATIQQATHECFELSFPQLHSVPWLRDVYRDADDSGAEDCLHALCEVIVDQPVPDSLYAPHYLLVTVPVVLPECRCGVPGAATAALPDDLKWLTARNRKRGEQQQKRLQPTKQDKSEDPVSQPPSSSLAPIVSSTSSSSCCGPSSLSFVAGEKSPYDRQAALLLPFGDVYESNKLHLVKEMAQHHEHILADPNNRRTLLDRTLMLASSALLGKQLSCAIAAIPLALPLVGSYVLSLGPVTCRSFSAAADESQLRLIPSAEVEGPLLFVKLKKIRLDLEPIAFVYHQQQSDDLQKKDGKASGTLKFVVKKAKIACTLRATLLSAGQTILTVTECRCDVQKIGVTVTCSRQEMLLRAAASAGGRIVRSLVQTRVESALTGVFKL
jgi:hypothetical protein